MGKVTSHISGGVKVRAILDDLLSSVTGRRIFTDIVTDRSLREKIELERRKRGYKGVVTKTTRSDAIKALRALKGEA